MVISLYLCLIFCFCFVFRNLYSDLVFKNEWNSLHYYFNAPKKHKHIKWYNLCEGYKFNLVKNYLRMSCPDVINRQHYPTSTTKYINYLYKKEFYDIVKQNMNLKIEIKKSTVQRAWLSLKEELNLKERKLMGFSICKNCEKYTCSPSMFDITKI